MSGMTVDIQQQYELDVYGKRGISLVKGEGSRLWDDQGNVYIDCIAGMGSANLGHGNPRILSALSTQATKLITCPGSYYNEAKAQLLQRLIDVAPRNLKRAFLCNSGTESVEAALKFARIHTDRKDFIAARGGFHGRTFGSMSATFKPKYSKGFEPLVPGFRFVSYNHVEQFLSTIDENVAAVILEIVQGEGGIHIADAEFLQVVQEECKRTGTLLIIDEVQTGFCRTGKMFACDHFDLQPDLLCVAKSIAAGLPMGAVLCSEAIQIPVGKHGSTFGGNPLVSAVAVAAINEMVDRGLAREAEEKGAYLIEQMFLDGSSVVREVRRLGLMVGIELKTRVRPYLQQLMKAGLLVHAAGSTVIRLLPPLVISYEELDEIAHTVRHVLSQPYTSM